MEPQRKRRAAKKKEPKGEPIYSRSMMTRMVALHMKYIGKNTKSVLEHKIREDIEGRCIVEGFVKIGSVKVISYSSGEVKGSIIQFQVMFECQVCFPVEGMVIQCISKNITKAGIRAEIQGEEVSPIVCFVSRDHHVNSAQFAAVNENDLIMVKIIGQRFELNDKYVSVLGELIVEREKQATNTRVRKKIEIIDDDNK